MGMNRCWRGETHEGLVGIQALRLEYPYAESSKKHFIGYHNLSQFFHVALRYTCTDTHFVPNLLHANTPICGPPSHLNPRYSTPNQSAHRC